MGAGTTVGLVASLVAGTVAFTLSFLAWRAFAGTPFGRTIAVLPVVYAGFVSYHGYLLVSGHRHSEVHGGLPEAIETLTFAGLLVFTVLVVRLHHRMSRRPEGRR